MGSPVLHGAWLREERERLGLSIMDVARALGVTWQSLATMARFDREIPAPWLPKLKKLGISVPEPEPKSGVESKSPAKSAENPKSEGNQETRLSRQKTRNEVSLIIQYRLMMAPKEGLSALEALSRIVQDMRQAGLETQLTHEQLAKAMAVLLQS